MSKHEFLSKAFTTKIFLHYKLYDHVRVPFSLSSDWRYFFFRWWNMLSAKKKLKMLSRFTCITERFKNLRWSGANLVRLLESHQQKISLPSSKVYYSFIGVNSALKATKKHVFLQTNFKHFSKNYHYRSIWPCWSFVLPLHEEPSKSINVGRCGPTFEFFKLSKLPLDCFSLMLISY